MKKQRGFITITVVAVLAVFALLLVYYIELQDRKAFQKHCLNHGGMPIIAVDRYHCLEQKAVMRDTYD